MKFIIILFFFHFSFNSEQFRYGIEAKIQSSSSHYDHNTFYINALSTAEVFTITAAIPANG